MPESTRNNSAPYRVLAVAGSLRRASLNRRLLTELAAIAEPALEVSVFEGLASIPLFDEDLERNGVPHAAGALAARIATADGVVIATPEYNQSIPGLLKNALDWVSRTPALEDKPVAVLGATAGLWGTRLAQATLRHTLGAMGAYVMPQPSVFVARADTLFDAQGRLIDGDLRERLDAFAQSFAEWIDAFAARNARRGAVAA
jgi:chromate reductase